MIVAVRSCRRRSGRPLRVVWDRLNAHRAAPVQAGVAAHPDDYPRAWLPPSAPELNPEALGTGAVKQDLLPAVPPSIDALHRSARRSFRRLGRRPDLLHSGFQHPRLTMGLHC